MLTSRAKWQSLTLAGTITAALIFVLWGPIRDEGPDFATPSACLEALREAGREGNLPQYLACLEKPLQSSEKNLITPGKLREQMRAIKSWTEVDTVTQANTAFVDVDQVRADGTWRVRYRFRRASGGWLISAIEPPREITGPPRFGTPVQ